MPRAMRLGQWATFSTYAGSPVTADANAAAALGADGINCVNFGGFRKARCAVKLAGGTTPTCTVVAVAFNDEADEFAVISTNTSLASGASFEVPVGDLERVGFWVSAVSGSPTSVGIYYAPTEVT